MDPVSLVPFTETPASVLVVVAHPDDIEYGTAAAVHRWTKAGADVRYVLLTSGEAGIDTMDPAAAKTVREAEERESAARVGVSSVDFLGWPDGAIEYGVALRHDIAAAIRRHRPEAVVASSWDDRFPGGMLNQADHRAVGLATVDAVADAGNRWLHRDLAEAGLEPWGGVRTLLIAPSNHATHYIDVTGPDFEAAVHSLEAHAAYNAALPADFPPPRQLLGFILGGTAQGLAVDAVEQALAVEVIRR